MHVTWSCNVNVGKISPSKCMNTKNQWNSSHHPIERWGPQPLGLPLGVKTYPNLTSSSSISLSLSLSPPWYCGVGGIQTQENCLRKQWLCDWAVSKVMIHHPISVKEKHHAISFVEVAWHLSWSTKAIGILVSSYKQKVCRDKKYDLRKQNWKLRLSNSNSGGRFSDIKKTLFI